MTKSTRVTIDKINTDHIDLELWNIGSMEDWREFVDARDKLLEVYDKLNAKLKASRQDTRTVKE